VDERPMTVSDALPPAIVSKVLRRDGIVSNRGPAPGAGDGSWCGLFPEATVMMSRKNSGAA
jgi:hypothetical protein